MTIWCYNYLHTTCIIHGFQTIYSWLPTSQARRLQILNLSLGSSRRDLQMFFLLFFLAAIVFGILIRLVESSDSIPDLLSAIWWATVTMTTVGFGDVHPTSFLGYIIGIICAIFGVMLAATLLPMIANKYYECFQRYEDVVRMKSRQPVTEGKHSQTMVNNENKEKITWTKMFTQVLLTCLGWNCFQVEKGSSCENI